jgi:prepilin-type N-terminal cleavage/methylation domain-containing protein
MTKGGQVGDGRRSEAGFTLVESLIAILVLVVGIAAIANLMAIAMSSNSVANMSTASATVASQQLEVLKATQFTTLAPGGSVTADVAGYYITPDTLVPGVGTIHTRWSIVSVNKDVMFITVNSQATGVLGPARTQSQFTTFRSCTDPSVGCP